MLLFVVLLVVFEIGAPKGHSRAETAHELPGVVADLVGLLYAIDAARHGLQMCHGDGGVLLLR